MKHRYDFSLEKANTRRANDNHRYEPMRWTTVCEMSVRNAWRLSARSPEIRQNAGTKNEPKVANITKMNDPGVGLSLRARHRYCLQPLARLLRYVRSVKFYTIAGDRETPNFRRNVQRTSLIIPQKITFSRLVSISANSFSTAPTRHIDFWWFTAHLNSFATYECTE